MDSFSQDEFEIQETEPENKKSLIKNLISGEKNTLNFLAFIQNLKKNYQF